MKAIKILSQGHAAVVSDAEIPTLPSDEWILVKTVAVALNPTDWKHFNYPMGAAQPTSGCDFAGIVEQVGSAVPRPLKKGNRVWGFTHGGNQTRPYTGAFGEYLVTKGGVVGRIPEGVSFEEAATAGVGILTVGQGLYQRMGLPWPDQPLRAEEKMPILIWGGSSATGALGIQFAKLSGFEVITTCSPRNFDYVKSLGADTVFDSRSPTVGADIRAHTNNKLYYAWDTIGEHGSPAACAAALASSAPAGQKLHYGTILMGPGMKPPRDDVEFTFTLGYTAAGEAFEIAGMKWEAKPQDYEFTVKWTELAEKLWMERKWRPHRQDVREGGLEGVLNGLEDMKSGKVSGVKLVYRVADP